MTRQTAIRGLLGLAVPALLLGPLMMAYAEPKAEAPVADTTAPAPAPSRLVEEYATVRVDALGRVFSVRLPGGTKEARKETKFRNSVQVLNRLAKDGWRVRTATTGTATGVGELLGKGDQQIIEYLLAREVAYTSAVDTGGAQDTGSK